MNSAVFKLIWFAFPVTKAVYAYLAYSNPIKVNNSFSPVSLLMLLFGFITCTVSILLSKKIYKKSFYENKIVKTFLSKPNSDEKTTIFNLFAMMLGLAENAALFGFIQYIITGNLIVGIILFAFCLIAWLFNYPKASRQDDGKLD
ncbi:MAG: hypothetical protein J5817_04300 [Treponema sp.]|nr:hypothetical protein [Treponema sp.]